MMFPLVWLLSCVTQTPKEQHLESINTQEGIHDCVCKETEKTEPVKTNDGYQFEEQYICKCLKRVLKPKTENDDWEYRFNRWR